MAQQLSDPPGDPVVAAIERVLGAERDGEAGLREDRQQAESLAAAARAQAAAIARRADACISKLHTAYLQKIQHDIEKLAKANGPAAADCLPLRSRRLDRSRGPPCRQADR